MSRLHDADPRYRKPLTAAGIFLATMALAACGGNSEAAPAQSPSNSSSTSASAEATPSISPSQSETQAPSVDLPAVNLDVTGFGSVKEAEASYTNNLYANVGGTETAPIFAAINGDPTALANAGISQKEVIANYLVGEYFLTKTKKLMDKRDTEQAPSQYGEGDPTTNLIDLIRAQTFALGTIINEQAAGKNVMQDIPVTCPQGSEGVNQALRPGYFGFTQERFLCTANSDIQESAGGKVFVTIADAAMQASDYNKRFVDTQILEVYKSIVDGSDKKVQAIVAPLDVPQQ